MMKISSEILQIGSYENFKILLKLLKQEKKGRDLDMNESIRVNIKATESNIIV